MLKTSQDEAGQAFKRAAEKLLECKREVLARWESKVRKEWESARIQSQLSLLDSLPEFLDQIIFSLHHSVSRLEREANISRIAQEHALERIEQQDYSIQHVVLEYEILRKVIFHILDQDQLCFPEVREAIQDFIASGVSLAAKEYASLVERKEREYGEWLSESSKQFRAVFDLAAAGKALIDVDSLNFMRVNRKLCEILGFTEGELLRKTFREIAYGEDWDFESQDLRKMIHGAKDKPILKRFVRKDGGTVWVLVSAAVIPPKAGQSAKVIATTFDVTAQKETEMRFQFLHTITDAALQNTTSYKELLTAMLDHTMTTFNAESVRISILESDDEVFEVRISRGQGMPVMEREPRGLRGNLDESSVRDRARLREPLRTARGRIGAIQIDRPSAPFSEDDWRLLELLADRIATAIENARLYETSRQTIAELKIERGLRERFVNSLSHDLRTPLTAIQISADLLGMELKAHTEGSMLVGKISENAKRADQMIQDLLDASRLRAGEDLRLNLEHTDLRVVVRQTLSTLESIYRRTFRLLTSGDLVGYWCASSMKRLIENLGTNAVKYGAADREVTIRVNGDDGKSVIISVHNYGKAISSEEQEELFDLYRRSQQTDHKKGWGIGLTIVKGIAAAHGGNVSIVSSDTEGTTFTVVLPRDARPFVN